MCKSNQTHEGNLGIGNTETLNDVAHNGTCENIWQIMLLENTPLVNQILIILDNS